MSVDQVTMAERYGRAIQSSHLEATTRGRTDVDILMASAMAKGPDGEPTIGAMLFRMQCEFDSAKGSQALAWKNMNAAMTIAQRVKAHSPVMGEELEAQAESAAVMAYAHILLKLPSLASTKEAFGNWCMVMAGKRRFMEPGLCPGTKDPIRFALWRSMTDDRLRVVSMLAGRVLDILLEPTCRKCCGRGFNGGYSRTKQELCDNRSGCGGSGRRNTDKIGNTKEQHEFTQFLFSESDKMLSNVERQMSVKLRGDA